MRLFITLLCLFSFSIGKAQRIGISKEEISIDAKYCLGSIYKHTQKLHLDPPTQSSELEISITHRTFGKRYWERINNCPAPSINFCWSQYGDFLGNAFSIYPGIEWSLLRNNSIDWRLKMGGGIGYAAQRWTRSDTMNNYLGSHLNNFTAISSGVSFRVSEHLAFEAGGRLSHMSNGAFRMPNFGINLFSAYAGISYHPTGANQNIRAQATTALSPPLMIGLRSSLAWSEQKIPNGPLASIFTQTIYLTKPFLRKHLLMVGADIALNNKALSNYRYNYLDGNLTRSAISSSVFIGGELLYGRMGIPFQLGIFTKQIRNESAWWYQKFGFQYYLFRNEVSTLKRLYIGPMLKSNKINADYIEFCLGAMF